VQISFGGSDLTIITRFARFARRSLHVHSVDMACRQASDPMGRRREDLPAPLS
jgi:hypothetical protein